MKNKLSISGILINSLFFLTFVLAIFYSFYNFHYKKDYLFIIEAPCGNSQQACFQRNCEDGECPPNNLSSYRVFKIRAMDFQKCGGNSCANLCPGSIQCEEVVCGLENEDICTLPNQMLP